MKCQICNENDWKYKCPTCFKRYCSLSCYKDKERHSHGDEALTSEKQTDEREPQESKQLKQSSEQQLKSERFNNILQDNPKLRELLQHNTVKFHLHRVYRILTTNGGDQQLSQEAREQLAIDYLNTLRYGGVHYNEAIEELCDICLVQLQEDETPAVG